MSNVFYRKYRPKNFREVSGQEFIIKVLQEAISSKTLSHAYLFAGPRGTGKTTLARIFAKALNCTNPEVSDPCGTCERCSSIEKGRFVDVIEMDAASHRGIDEIRQIKEAVEFQPMHSLYKIYIIDEAHMLTKEAFNALLKILEEPPRYVVFILATTEPEKMIPTVLSRVQRFDFKKLSFKEVKQKLERIIKEEKIQIPKEALSHICYLSEGCLRDAETMLNQIAHVDFEIHDLQTIFNRLNSSTLIHFLSSVATKDSSASLSSLKQFEEFSIPPSYIIKDTLSLARKILLLKLHADAPRILETDTSKEDIEALTTLAKKFETKHLTMFVQNLIEARKNTYYSPIPFLPLELAVIDSVDSQTA